MRVYLIQLAEMRSRTEKPKGVLQQNIHLCLFLRGMKECATKNTSKGDMKWLTEQVVKTVLSTKQHLRTFDRAGKDHLYPFYDAIGSDKRTHGTQL